MLKEQDLLYIIENRKWKRDLSKISDAATSLLFPFLFISLGLMPIIFGKQEDSMVTYTFSLPLLLAGTLLLYFVFKALKFENTFWTVQTPLDKTQNKNLINEILARYTKVKSIKNSEEAIVIQTKISLFSWGEEITFIVRDNEILINSYPKGQPLTIWKDRKNIRYFTEQIQSVY